MAVPKRKTTPGRGRQRRSGNALKKINIAFDSNTGEPKLSHHVSLKDGYYNGKVMVAKYNIVKIKKIKKEEESNDSTN